jgi:hypothetical protein
MSVTTDTEQPSPVVTENKDGDVTVEFPKQKKEGEDERLGRDPAADDDAAEQGAAEGQRPTRSQRRRMADRRNREQSQQLIEQLAARVDGQERMLAALTRNQFEQSMRTLRSEADTARAAYAEAQRRHKEAIDKGDGGTATEATTVMRNAENYYNQLRSHAERLQQYMQPAEGGDEPQQPQQRQQPQDRGRNRVAVRKMEAFLDARPWIDPESDDTTQRQIRLIDQEVRNDGFEGDDDDYWEELDARLKKHMPHVYRPPTRQSRDDGGRRRQRDDDDDGGPPLGGSGSRGEGLGGGRFRLTPEQLKGMEEAGIDLTSKDPAMKKRRDRILAAYSKGPQPR